MMNKTFIILSIIMLNTAIAHAQVIGVKPKVGMQIEDYTFTNMTHYNKSQVSVKDFRGKWLLLDFWASSCSSNTTRLPHIEKLNDEFKQDVQFLMVVTDGGEFKGVQKIFEKLRQKLDIDIPAAYDSVLFRKWEIFAMPYIIIVDPYGTVRAITHGYDLQSSTMRELLAGRNLLVNPDEKMHRAYDMSKFANPDDTTLLFRSVLSKWAGEHTVGSNLEDYVKWPEESRKKGIRFLGISLERLYATAYLGDNYFMAKYLKGSELFYPHVLKKTQSDLFEFDTTYTDYKGLYNLKLDVHASKSDSLEYLQHILKHELKTIFGFEVTIEKMSMPVWRLLAKKDAEKKLRTKGGPEILESSPVGLKMQNIPMKDLCQVVTRSLMRYHRVFVGENETGITGNIDINLDAVISDLADMNKELNKYGLYLKQENLEMNVIVIKDPARS